VKAHWITAVAQGGTWHLALKHLPLGTVRLRARAVDLAGNVQKPAASRTLKLTR
jgi:hypothetical protein